MQYKIRLNTRSALIIGGLVSLVLLLVAAFTAYVGEEHKYVDVALGMVNHHVWLVPRLHGHPYPDKPPLYFWLMESGWFVVGINHWWPRVIPAIASWLSILMTVRLAALLWPERAQISRFSVWVLLGALYWVIYSAAIRFDMLIVLTSVVAMYGMWSVIQSKNAYGWLVLGVAAGIAMLAKGPVTLLFTIMPAALAPFWLREEGEIVWSYWYVRLFLATLLAAMIILAWAIPAAIQGGPSYAQAIFVGQSVSRISGHVGNSKPWYTYLTGSFYILFPWLFWTPLWTGFVKLYRAPREAAVRWCVVTLFAVMFIFSLVGCKELRYLLPLFPIFALLSARALSTLEKPVIRFQWITPLFFIAIALALTLLPLLGNQWFHSPWLAHFSSTWGIMLLLLFVPGFWMTRKHWSHQLIMLSVSMWAMILVYYASGLRLMINGQ